MHLRVLLFVLTVTSAALAPTISYAHDDHDADEINETMARYADMVQFAEIAHADAASRAFVQFGGAEWPVGGPLWDLTRSWLRINYHGLKVHLKDRMPISEEEFLKRAEPLVAKTFFRGTIADPMFDILEHIVMGTADVGAQFGVTAAAAKVALEVTETVLSYFTPLMGFHVACAPIDIAILFAARQTNTTARAFQYAPAFGQSRLATTMHVSYLSAILARAHRRVRFVKGPVTLDELGLARVDAEGPNDVHWGWLPKHTRATWLRELDRNGEATMTRAEALGQRRARYAFLRVGRDIGGRTARDKALSKVWIMSVQENVIEPAFARSEDASPADTMSSRFTPEHDDIRLGLAEEIGRGNSAGAAWAEKVLRDFEVAFNPAVPRDARKAHVDTLEASLYGFWYREYAKVLAHKSQLHKNEKDSYLDRFRKIGRMAKLRWRGGRFASYILDLGDFMRVAATSENAEALTARKYDTLQAIQQVFELFRHSGDIVDVRDVASLNAFERSMDARFREALAYQPWAEKERPMFWRLMSTKRRQLMSLPPWVKSTHSVSLWTFLTDWRQPKPTCHEMEHDEAVVL